MAKGAHGVPGEGDLPAERVEVTNAMLADGRTLQNLVAGWRAATKLHSLIASSRMSRRCGMPISPSGNTRRWRARTQREHVNCGLGTAGAETECCDCQTSRTSWEHRLRAAVMAAGFLSIAAHGHADALSDKVRPTVWSSSWTRGRTATTASRSGGAARSTRAHNTIEVDGADQAVEAGPFMWGTHADAVVDHIEAGPDGVQMWAHHHAYSRFDAALCHDHRSTSTVPDSVNLTDTVTGSLSQAARLFWHLGPGRHRRPR